MRVLATLALTAFFASPSTAQPSLSGYPPRPQVTNARLYVLDCGTIISHNPENFGVPRAQVDDPDFSDPCFLVVHPKGILLFDTGLVDSHVGRPIWEDMTGKEGVVKFTTLKGELANLGVSATMITYLAISHSHWDHVSNANDYAGSTWLARKAEYDFMFAASPALQKPYAALKTANTKFIDGDYDVFGDGSVLLLSTPGHTPGHQSLYVKLAHTGGVVVSGDLYHYTAERTSGGMSKREETLETPASRKKIEEFLARTRSQLWIGHAIDWYRNAIKAPGYYD